MGTLAILHTLKVNYGQLIGFTARVLGRNFALVAIIVFLTACGQPSTSEGVSGAAPRAATVSLPTSQPTLAPSPANTRVLPAPEFTPVPTMPITPTLTPIPDETRGLVVQVIAGDTIAVVMEGDSPSRAYVVKYLGIDSPPNTADDPWGVVAYETNRKLTNLKVVRLVRDQTDFDDEERLLRYVYVGDELMSIILTEQGLARANVVEPNTRFQREIEEAEARARDGRLGLWGQPPTPSPSSDQADSAEEESTTQPATNTPEPTLAVTVTVEPDATEESSTGEAPAGNNEASEPAASPTGAAGAESVPADSDNRLQGP